MSNLLNKQFRFSRFLGMLLDYIYTSGYECTMGETWRTPEQAKYNQEHGLGISNSLHLQRLAIDINLFKNGKLLDRKEDYAVLGNFWKGLDTENRWGGDFKKSDPYHFSITHEGVS